jgi:photosystem II stability/assembly factor-like uncharacterized protein
MKKHLHSILALFVVLLIPFLGYASWEILDLPTDRGFTETCAIDEQNIFVVGHQALWSTFDGINWELDTTYRPHYIYFVDDTLGFIGGNRFPNWNVDFPPGQSLLGYGGYSLSGDLNYPRCHLYKTTDGGWHWDTLPPLPEVYLESQEDINLEELCFPVDPDTGYVTAMCREWISEEDVIERRSYFKTTDGGETWVWIWVNSTTTILILDLLISLKTRVLAT